MTRIAILTASLLNGDAVSNDAIGMYQVLVSLGYDVRLFADDWDISGQRIWHTNKIRNFLSFDTTVLIYHFSFGWDFGLNLLRTITCKKIIKYHNITPPDFFKGISLEYTNACAAGRKHLNDIARLGCDLYLGDSEYNKQELVREGVEDSRCMVISPFHHIDRLHLIEADLSVLNTYRDGKTNILMVGRVSPNKGHETLIDAFATYYYNYNNNSRLLIVGKEDERLVNYTGLLHNKVNQLGIQEMVVFTGQVSDNALKAYYLVADIFMMTSEHEGFCVPLVEAMAMKVPIVAYGTSAVPGTIGNSGLVWEEPDPFLIAGSVDCIVRDESVRVALGEMGWRRYQEYFTNDNIRSIFLDTLKGLL